MKTPLTSVYRSIIFGLSTEEKMQTNQITSQPKPTASFYTGNITPREVQVLTLLAMGNINKQIAHQLNISTETVKKHLNHIYKKTGAHNKIEALNKTKWLTAAL